MNTAVAPSATKTAPSESFFRALNAFRNRLEPHELELFQEATLEDLENSLNTIQQRQVAQKNVLGITRLKGFLEAAGQLGKIVEVFLNVNDAVAFVWGPIKLVLQTTSTWSHAFDQLLDAYKSLGEQFPLIMQYESLFGEDAQMRKILELLYGDILDFHRGALPFLRKRIWKQVFRSMWDDFTGRFNETISSIQRHARMLESQAHLLHFQNDSVVRASLLNLESQQRTALYKFEEAEQERKLTNLHAVRQWVGAMATEGTHQDACERWSQYHGTGQWILREKQIHHWLNDDIPKYSSLWLHGIPGAGKTVLTSIIVEGCKKVNDANIVYFYCRSDDEQKNKFLSILKGLLGQVIAQFDDLIPYFHEKSRASREAVLTDVKMARELFEPACHSTQRLFVVIDGLDECSHSDRRQLLSFLTSLSKRVDAHNPGRLRVLISSQTEADIARLLPSADFLKLLPRHNMKDILQFVSVEALQIQQKFELTDDQRKFIELQISRKAAGQFIYARLVVDNLLSQANTEHLVEEIHSSRFPKKLSEAYQRILDRIRRYSEGPQWHYVEQILGWMVCAARPMSWNEMQTAISVDVANGYVDFYGKSLRFDIKEVCGSLVSVDDYGKITLVHSTARMFITESGHIVPELVELELSTLCLQYLMLPCFESDLSPSTLTNLVLHGQYAFQDYAIAKWEHHFQQAIRMIPSIWQRIDQHSFEYALQVFTEAVSEFVTSYKDDLLGPKDTTNPSRNQMLAIIEMLQEFCAFEDALKIFDHNVAHRSTSPTAFNDISLQRLKRVYQKTRAEIENLPPRKDNISRVTHDLTIYYGTNRFKCPQLTCYNFHQGFPDAKTLKAHLDRHLRPYQCPVLDCSALEFGFISKNNLDAHIRAYHPELEDTTKVFPTRKIPEENLRGHLCEICQKTFTRKAILGDHRLVHAGQKPHQCRHCGKAFTRKNDRDRHERTIHIQRDRHERTIHIQRAWLERSSS